VSPGHGEPVGLEFIAGQRDELTLIADLSSEVVAERCSMADALLRSPYPADALRTAVERLRTTRSEVAK